MSVSKCDVDIAPAYKTFTLTLPVEFSQDETWRSLNLQVFR